MAKITVSKLVTMFILSMTAEAFSSSHHLKTPTLRHGFSSSFSSPTTIPTFKHNEKKYQGNSISTISSSTAMEMSLALRGGSVISNAMTSINSSPSNFFNANLIGLGLLTVMIRIAERLGVNSSEAAQKESSSTNRKPASVKSLQIRFLLVFWLLRCADWLQGPYFYEVYSSKVFNGLPATLATVSKLFLTGFASTALFGPLVGKTSDTKGRKRGTLVFALLYSLGAASTKSNVLSVLLLGRVMSGIGTSLLFSAPESWLVGEAMKDKEGDGGKYLGETFGMAYAGDSIVAILAGQFAGAAAGKRGPTGPFELSIGFLAAGALLATFLWNENKAEGISSSDGNEKNKPTIRDAVNVVKDDPKIMLVGAAQSLFEAAMYIFVLQWPPAITGLVSTAFGGASTPYGTVFSCFMTSCLLGSTIFGQLVKKNVPTETFTSGMLAVATLAMGVAAWVSTTSSAVAMPFAVLVAAFFAFEACVGMYFPSIGTLRSKYVPDSHRSVIMNLFGIPLNVLVVSVFLSIKRLGVGGALSISTGALGLATLSMLKLKAMVRNEGKQA